jgi:hypothetical protein
MLLATTLYCIIIVCHSLLSGRGQPLQIFWRDCRAKPRLAFVQVISYQWWGVESSHTHYAVFHTRVVSQATPSQAALDISTHYTRAGSVCQILGGPPAKSENLLGSTCILKSVWPHFPPWFLGWVLQSSCTLVLTRFGVVDEVAQVLLLQVHIRNGNLISSQVQFSLHQLHWNVHTGGVMIEANNLNALSNKNTLTFISSKSGFLSLACVMRTSGQKRSLRWSIRSHSFSSSAHDIYIIMTSACLSVCQNVIGTHL